MIETRFEWDPDKDSVNQKKHGVPFHRAQYAFADPRRVVAKDLSHSQKTASTVLVKSMAAS
jgi:uncharacterized protein